MDFNDLWKDFLDETLPLVERAEADLLALERLTAESGLQGEQAQVIVLRLLGSLHTMKGNCGMMGLSELSSLLHEMEDKTKNISTKSDRTIEWLLESLDYIKAEMISAANPSTQAATNPATQTSPAEAQARATPGPSPTPPPGQAPETTKDLAIRVDFQKLDVLLDTVGELIVEHTGLIEAVAMLKRQANEESWDRVERHVEMLGKLGNQLQESITEARMLPIGNVFQRFVRMVRDLARKEKKRARLELRGSEVEVDKTILDALAEPLLHLLRNSIDHGIEEPEERLAKNKKEEGTIILSAVPQGSVVLVSLVDDGRGINTEEVKQRAVERGFHVEGLSPQEINELIFQPGFSTARQVSSLSGRGVGLDVVKRTVDSLGGRLEVTSILGRGTRFLLTIPLSLSLIKALLVDVGGEVYAIPISHIVESLRVSSPNTLFVAGSPVVRWRGQLLPLFDLAQHFRSPLAEQPGEYCVVIQDGARVRGLMVHSLLGQREIVAKPLEAILGRVSGINGVALLGDGRVVPILDVFTLGAEESAKVRAEGVRS